MEANLRHLIEELKPRKLEGYRGGETIRGAVMRWVGVARETEESGVER